MMLIEKIQSLKDKFIGRRGDRDDIASIDNWIEEAKRLMLINSLKGHDGIKYVTDIFESEVKKINSVLKSKYSKELSDYERDRLLDKKELSLKYLGLFKDVELDLERLEELVDDELSKVN